MNQGQANAALTTSVLSPFLKLVQWCRNNSAYSTRYFCQRKAEEGGDAGASLTDDNAAMAEITGAVFTVISAMLY